MRARVRVTMSPRGGIEAFSSTACARQVAATRAPSQATPPLLSSWRSAHRAGRSLARTGSATSQHARQLGRSLAHAGSATPQPRHAARWGRAKASSAIPDDLREYPARQGTCGGVKCHPRPSEGIPSRCIWRSAWPARARCVWEHAYRGAPPSQATHLSLSLPPNSCG